MFRKPIANLLLSALLAFACSGAAFAENALDTGKYVIHYNALATSDLPADVATAYGIVRSSHRAMLNVAVLRKQSGKVGQAVRAKVTARVANLTGQVKRINLREITEQQAIYYIGDVAVTNGETLVFHLHVIPRGEKNGYDIEFQHQFFTE
ncbi:MAG: DUF4426 domain-containing protein [Gammaproteobacteria bacterium]|jgi:hypothetical protein